MYKPLLTILFTVITCVFVNAQRPEQKEVTITGKVIDKETNQELEYATIGYRIPCLGCILLLLLNNFPH